MKLVVLSLFTSALAFDAGTQTTLPARCYINSQPTALQFSYTITQNNNSNVVRRIVSGNFLGKDLSFEIILPQIRTGEKQFHSQSIALRTEIGGVSIENSASHSATLKIGRDLIVCTVQDDTEQ